jgi:tRNA dimethylallyltransferase
MAIGTAQPTADELAAATHYFIADREVEDDFNCGRYEVEALELLERLFAENDYVVAVGGSGLYIQALCDGMDNLPEADDAIRAQLKNKEGNFEYHFFTHTTHNEEAWRKRVPLFMHFLFEEDHHV